MNSQITNAQRADILIQALPYIKEYYNKILVVKYGGNAMINEELKEAVMGDIVLLSLIGVKVVLVHGGGPEITELLTKIGKKSEFVNGLRVTDRETVDVVQMVLAGKVNKTLVNLLEMNGGKAMGISGMDGRLIEAKMKDERLGYVGEITGINISPVTDLLERGYIPDLHRGMRPQRQHLQHQRRYGGGIHCRCASRRASDYDDRHCGDPAGQGRSLHADPRYHARRGKAPV